MRKGTRQYRRATSDCRNEEEIKAKEKTPTQCIWNIQLLRAWPSEILSRFFKARKRYELTVILVA